MKTSAKAFIREKIYRSAFSNRVNREVEMARVTPKGNRGKTIYDFCSQESKVFGLVPPPVKTGKGETGAFYGEWVPVTITIEVEES